MTSPVSAIEAIEPAERIWAYTNGRGLRVWTPMMPALAGVHEEQEYVHSDVHAALARQAEALQRENAEKDAEISKLLDFVGKAQGVAMGVAMSGRAHPNPDGALMGIFNDGQELIEAIRARALLGGENAE